MKKRVNNQNHFERNIRKIVILLFLSIAFFSFGMNKGRAAFSKVTLDLSSTYILGNEDVVQISVWERPEFESKVPIRPDGKISIELIGDVQATGLTPLDLAQSIQTKLAEYVKNPRVTVTVAEFKSKKVIVEGEVPKPGTVIIKGTLTALEAVVECGSPTHYANLKKATVIRGDPKNPQIIPIDLDRIMHKGENQLDIYLEDGDIVYVPPKAMVGFGYIVDAFFFPFRAIFGIGTLTRVATGL